MQGEIAMIQLHRCLYWIRLNIKTGRNDIVTCIYYKAIVTAIKRNLFWQNMIYLVNGLELNGQKYQSNGTVRE